MPSRRAGLIAFLFGSIAAVALPAQDDRKEAIPDFTKGDTIPAKATHDWNLGPTGARGWMYCEQLVTTQARQVAITAVEAGSPAAAVLAPGDVLLGVGGRPFTVDPRAELGRAITMAESEAGGGALALTRWRAGRRSEVVVQLPVLGTYSETAPYDCPKSRRILERGIAALAARMAAPDYAERCDPIPRALNALALLAAGDEAQRPLLERELRWAAAFEAGHFRTWHYGYVMILLAEAVQARGDIDESIRAGLRRLAMAAAEGQSAVGSWGHDFARPDGRLGGYGMMNSPGLPLTLGLVLARAAGVAEPAVTRAIDASARLLRFYSGKGAVPYGDHAPWIETHEDNGKCGMAAVLFDRLGEAEPAQFFARMALASHGNERDQGHTGNFFNVAWALPAIARSGRHATGAWMGEFGGWYADLARRADGSFAHQGPPEPQHDSYQGFDATGGWLLGFALPLRRLALTGREPSHVPLLDAAAAERVVADGRGWDNRDRLGALAALPEQELLARLRSWSPVVRERAAAALARRDGVSLEGIVGLLSAPELDARLGACQSLAALRGAAAPAVPQLRAALAAPDLWLRVKAADALAAIGAPALPALPDLLARVAQGGSPADPRGMEQRFLSFALFGELLRHDRALAAADRDALHDAIAAVLRNEDGRARGEVGGVLRRLSFAEVRPLLPAILAAVVTPAPSGEMFADGVRLAGLEVMASHHVEEGLGAGADYLVAQNPWASEERTPQILRILERYGAHAQAVLPRLRAVAAQFERGEDNFPAELSARKAAAVRASIARIEAASERPRLQRIR
jgi:hypothetical protein